MAFVLFIWPSIQKATESRGRENYSFGPQTQAKCQGSSMVKHGQPSPVVSLPFRLYGQLSDPTVWKTIISYSPRCVPPVSQTYSQTTTTSTCAQKFWPQKCPQAQNQLYLLKKKITHMNFPLLHSFVKLNPTPLAFICTIPCPIHRALAGRTINVGCKTDIEKRYAIPWKERIHRSECNLKAWRVRWKTSAPFSEGTWSADGYAFPQWKFHHRPMLWFLANGTLHENISMQLHYLLAQLTRWF